nr:hypothetical protein OG296_08920 [Streptomyces sp. NBC_01001]
MAVAFSGRADARLAVVLRDPVSRATLLRLMTAVPDPAGLDCAEGGQERAMSWFGRYPDMVDAQAKALWLSRSATTGPLVGSKA